MHEVDCNEYFSIFPWYDNNELLITHDKDVLTFEYWDTKKTERKVPTPLVNNGGYYEPIIGFIKMYT